MNEMTPKIGLEIHAAITSTDTKLFSHGANNNIDMPNTQVDLLDIGMPGSLPVLNNHAVVNAVRACVALNMKINERFWFDRKNYFYPDLPLGYQITQFFRPIGLHGHLPVYIDGAIKKIRIKQLHMETDVGKSIHEKDYTLLDYNRCGSPLMEIVTEPDMANAEEVIFFLRMLKSTLKHINVCDGNMELGNLRVDVNISVGHGNQLGTRAEIKNLNSFKAIRKAIEFEKERHISLIKNNEKVHQETRLFNEKDGKTFFMRFKEDTSDYMYFKDPDLPEYLLDDDIIVEERQRINTLPEKIFESWKKRFGLKDGDIMTLVEDPSIIDFLNKAFEGASLEEQKQILKLMLGEIFARLKDDDFIAIKPSNLQLLARVIIEKSINAILVKEILDEMWDSDASPYDVIKEKGIDQTGDANAIMKEVEEVVKANPSETKRYLDGDTKLRGFFIGQVMKKLNNRANPKLINDALDEVMKKIS
jgi:aspartyl-tRNA(Asn)/glutamyl-tRNA(Gln) amidotransferase subunit B